MLGPCQAPITCCRRPRRGSGWARSARSTKAIRIASEAESRLTEANDPTGCAPGVGPPAAENENLSPGRRLGHYTIKKRLGAGGMGAVYEATDDLLGRLVAIKVILAGHQDDEGRKRFVREAQAASALNHPNIVTVHEAGRDGDIDFIVMERIAGETLGDAIGVAGLPAGTAVLYATQIAAALAAAHNAGIVHRDLKPTNIMVTGRSLVKVLDFGLAMRTLPEAAETSTDPGGRMSRARRRTCRLSRPRVNRSIRARMSSVSAACSTRC